MKKIFVFVLVIFFWLTPQIQADVVDDNTAIYVSPEGLDTNPGTLLLPVATIAGAAQRAREYKTTPGLPAGGLNVYFRQGVYPTTSKYTFVAADAGQNGKPIIYRSYPGEMARITGAVQLDPDNFTLVTSSDTVWPRISAAARGYVYKMDISSYGIMYGTPKSKPTELIFNQAIMQLGRWPNAIYATTVSPTTTTSFTYTGTQPSNWLTAPDAYVSGHFSNGYFSSIAAISSISTATKKITLAENPLDRGILSNKGWYAFNLLEEVDSPGEYYIDKTNKILYFWPPDALSGSEVCISNTANLIELGSGANYLQFKDLIFEAFTDRILVMLCGRVTFDGCTVRNCGGIGISFSVVTNSTVKNCKFYDTGWSSMGFSGCGSNPYLTNSNNLIANNYAARVGRFKSGLAYAPIMYVFSNNCGITFRNNHFEDGVDAGLMISGQNHLVEFNRFTRCSSDSDDMGATYSAGDWTRLQGCVFRYNEVYDNTSSILGDYGSHGVSGIYFDMHNSGGYAFGNILHTIGRRAFLSNGGRDTRYSNNIIVDTPLAHYVADTASSETCETLLNPLLGVNYNMPGSPWYISFPHLLEIPGSCSDPTFSNYKHPLHCSIDKTITWNCPTWTTGVGIPYYSIAANNLKDTDPRFIDDANRIFALKDNSPAYNCGFTRIPWERIGLIEVNAPSNPIPLDGTANQYRPVTLHWAPAFDANHSKVYFSTNYNSVSAHDADSYQGTVYDQSFFADNLAQYTTYYWSVEEYDGSSSLIGTGPVWSFTTGTERIFGADEAADYSATNNLDSVGFGGSGWASAWERESGTYCAVDVVSGTLDPSFTGYPYATSGNSLMSDSDWTPSDAMRKLAVPINLKTNNTYYLSYLVKGTDSSNVNCTMDFYDAKAGNLGFGVGMFYSGTQFGIKNFSGSYQYFGSWSSNTTYLVIAKIQASVTGNDTVSVKVYSSGTGAPPSTEPAIWDSTVTGTSDVVCSWIKLDGRTSATYQWYLDEIRLRNSWADILPGSVTYASSAETFDYSATNTLSSVGTGGIGWASNWEGATSTTCDVDVVSASLSPGFDYTTAGNKIYFDADGAQNEACRQLSGPINFNSDQTYYVSYLVRATDSNNVYYYMGLRDGTKGGTAGVSLAMYYKGYAGLGSAQFAIRDFNNVPQYFGSWSSDTTYLVIAKIQASISGDDTVSMNVYGGTTAPPHTEPAAWDKTVAGTSSATFEWIRSTARASSTYGVYCDEIHIEQSWAEITAPVIYAARSAGDFNGDCQVSMIDISMFSDNWLNSVPPADSNMDLVQDNTIDLKDFAVIAANWLSYTPNCE